MICVECSSLNIGLLYYKYKSEYIKLTVCSKCGKVADKYIEYDNVILYIDIILVKPQAYRHLAYNITESEMMKDEKTLRDYKPSGSSYLENIKTFYSLYRRNIRFMVMMILFDVYLTWAYEEREVNHTIMMLYVLNQSLTVQYLFFLLRLIVDHLIFIFTLVNLFKYCLNFGAISNKVFGDSYQSGYYNSVLLSTILTSSSIKLFPIIMLIWPYDNVSLSASIINIAAFYNTLESLKVVTSKRYLSIFLVLSISVVLKLVLTNLLLGTFIHSFTNLSFKDIISNEIQQVGYTIDTYKYFIANINNLFM